MAVTTAQSGHSSRFVCRSYMAVVLAPEPPIVEWVADIEQRIKGAGRFLAGSPIVLDLSAVKLSKSAIAHLVAERSEEHTSELQSLRHLVCRLLLEKKKK